MSEATEQPLVDPERISTEVYLLDALLAHAQAVVNQIAFRKKADLAQLVAKSLGPLVVLRDELKRDAVVILPPPPPGVQ